MPRRPPSRVRVEHRRSRSPRHGISEPGLARGSGKLASAVARLEHDRLWPGAIAAALRRWSKVARRPDLEPLGGSCCPLCNPFYMNDERELLELALYALAPR